MNNSLTAAERVNIARHPQRPNISDYIGALFTDFFEQKGDRLCGEDTAILGGVALGLAVGACGSLLADKISNKWAKRSEVKRTV